MPDPSEANRGQFHPAGTQQPPGVMASRRGDHRGRRPDHDDTGIAREKRESLISLLSTQARIKAGQPVGVHRVTKAPAGKARGSAGSILDDKRGDDRYEETRASPEGTSQGR